MKIFVLGLPKSGRSIVAHAITDYLATHRYRKAVYIDAMTWIKDSFREQKQGEHSHHYEDEYHHFLSIRRTTNPSLVIDHLNKLITDHWPVNVFVIDGIASPKDFAELFDYRQDVVIFLNRTDNIAEFKDHENIGVSVMRDYCFWMASAGLLTKEKWLEFNFKIPGDEADFVKELGSKNSVFIVRSINKAISLMVEKLSHLLPDIQCK
jgi:hypothetical protein